jgi:hypothetical protein
MRVLAAALRATASKAASIDQAVWGRVSALQFSGPAATRIAETIGSWHGDVSGAAEELAAAAGLLERSASDVEAQQLARARMLEQRGEQAHLPLGWR